VLTVRKFQGFGAGGSGHFGPGLFQGIDDLVVGGFGGEVGELVLQKDKAKSVFEDAAVRVGREILFEIEVLDAEDEVVRVANGAEDFAGFFGVKLLEGGAPLEIARAGHGVRGTGDFPAAEMLAAGGEAELLGGIRAKFEDPFGEFFREEKFARLRCPAGALDIRVSCVILIKAGDGRFEAVGVADYTRHVDIVIAGGEAAMKGLY
jgi:hypothetical protein